MLNTATKSEAPGTEQELTDGFHLVILSLIHISEPTRRTPISYAVFCCEVTS